MGTETKILLGLIGVGAVVGGVLYVRKKGGIQAVLNQQKPTTQQAFSPIKTNTTVINTAYITPTKTRTTEIQKKLVSGGYLSPTGVDGAWGTKTDTAYSKATSEKGLTRITDERSYLNWLRDFDGKTSFSSGSSGSSSASLASIAKFINNEFRSFTTNYGAIRDYLKPLTAKQIVDLDKLYREYSAKGLVNDFKSEDAGGKVESETYNVSAIRDILSDSGLKGLNEINALAGFLAY